MECWPVGAAELARDLPRLLTPGGLSGTAVEVGWWSVHVATYPWGLLRGEEEPADRYPFDEPRPGPALLDRPAAPAGTPILLIHGMIDNRAVFGVLRRRLHRRGFETRAMSYSPVANDVRGLAVTLAARVETLVARTGYERVHVIGHSMGGLVARYYVQRLGGDQRVHTLVTLGTPHSGSLHARLLPVRLGRQLRPGSRLLAELAGPAPGCRTRFVAFWSDADQVIVPHVNARLDHPDLTAHNVRIHDTGHLSLPRVGRVAREIGAVLHQLDRDGRPQSTARACDHITPAAPAEVRSGSRTGPGWRIGVLRDRILVAKYSDPNRRGPFRVS